MLWMSLTYVLDWVPNSFFTLPVLLVFGNISLLRSQIRCHAYPKHDNQPLTERKTPTLTPAVLSLLEKVQKAKHKPGKDFI